MKRLPRDQQKELADQARLMRAWKAWHAEQLDEALAGLHGAMVAELMTLLDRHELNSAAALRACVQRMDWSTVKLRRAPHGAAPEQLDYHSPARTQRLGGDRRSATRSTLQRVSAHQAHAVHPLPAKADSSPEGATAERTGRDVTATVSNRVSDDNE